MPQVRRAIQRWFGSTATIGLCCTYILAASVAQQPATDAPGLRVAREALDRGEYEDALQRARAALAETELEHGSGSLEEARVLDLLVEALIAAGRAATNEALALAGRALELKQRHLPADHFEVAASLDSLGSLHTARGEYAKALPLHEKVLAILADSGNEARVADTLDRQAFALINLEKFDEARVRLERARGIRERDADGSPLAFAGTVELLAALHRYRGDFREAQSLIDRALEIRQRLAPEHPATASLLHLQGDVFFLTGDLSSAGRTYTTAIEMATRALGSSHPTVSVYSRKLALVEWSFGNSEEARRLRENAVRVAEASLAPCHPDLANAFNDLAISYLQEGTFVEARSLFERALSRYEECLGRAHSSTAAARFNLANVAIAIGDLREAEHLLNQVEQIWSAALGPEHPFVARALDFQGEVATRQRRFRTAQSRLERSLAIRRKAFGSYHPDVARTLTRLAVNAERTRNLPAALKYIDEAIQTNNRSGAVDDPSRATMLVRRAYIERLQGNLEDAHAHMTEALEITRRQLGPTHPSAAAVSAELAPIDFRLGDYQQALDGALQAERAGQQLLRFTIRELSDRQAMSFASQRPKGLDLALSGAALTGAETVAPVYDSLIRSRGLILNELSARVAAARGSSDPDIARFSAAVTSARHRYANLALRSLQNASAVPVKRLEEARVEKEAAERALAERSVAARAELEQTEAGIDAVRAALPPRAALVSFVRYNRTIPAVGAAALADVPSYAALVVPAGATEPVFIALGSAPPLETTVRIWRSEAGGGPLAAGTPAVAERNYRAVATRLRRAIWDPIAPHLGDASQVFIVPDGVLNLVNFAALPAGDGKYLAESDVVLHYLSTERDLVRTPDPSPARSLLVLGGAEFGSRLSTATQIAGRRSACAALGGRRFEDLPGTREEAADIAQLWKAATTDDAVLLTGADATEPALKSFLGRRRIVHLATHGFFLGDCAIRPGGTRAVGGLTTTLPSDTSAFEDNPLLLSGLALAGANRRAATLDEDDGIVTAEEIASLDLQGTEWAVLSACDTGLGEVKMGEGVFGLRRAFQIAGARTVIMSLWSVDDQATRNWMRALYQARLTRNLSTAESVREASVTVLSERRSRGRSTHPFFWAAFVAAGDWR